MIFENQLTEMRTVATTEPILTTANGDPNSTIGHEICSVDSSSLSFIQNNSGIDTLRQLSSVVAKDIRSLDVVQRPQSLQRFLNPVCIKSVLEKRSISAERIICKNNTSQLPSNKSNNELDPCLSENYAQYITKTFNDAIDCLSKPGQRIDPNIIFEKINNESAFRNGLINKNGNATAFGISQLTADSVNEILNLEQPAGAYLDALFKANPTQCKPFVAAVDSLRKSLEITKSIEKQPCPIMSLKDGIARSAILGLGLFLYYREGDFDNSARSVLNHKNASSIKIDKKDQSEILDLLALIIYNKGPSNSNLNSELAKIAAKSKRLNRRAGGFVTSSIVRNHFEYLRAIDKKRAEAEVVNCSIDSKE